MMESFGSDSIARQTLGVLAHPDLVCAHHSGGARQENPLDTLRLQSPKKLSAIDVLHDGIIT